MDSLTDTLVRLLSLGDTERTQQSLAGWPLPPVTPQAIDDLQVAYPGILSPDMRRLLQVSSGVSGTVLGDLDFTGRSFPEEALPVFRPCLTVAVDDEGRRWIAETSGGRGLAGPVWCILPRSAVTLWIAEDLAGLLSIVRSSARPGDALEWLHRVDTRARWVWTHRKTLGIYFRNVCRADKTLRGWVMGMPCDAYVYDLRLPWIARGVPHGHGWLYRCGRLPIFALAPETPVA